jgi:hypothetical protein
MDDGLMGLVFCIKEYAPVLDSWIVIDGNREGNGGSHVEFGSWARKGKWELIFAKR